MTNFRKLLSVAAIGGLTALSACDLDVTYGPGGWDRDHGHHHGGGGHRYCRGRNRGDYWRNDCRGGRFPGAEESKTAAQFLAEDYGISTAAAATLLDITDTGNATPGLKAMGLKTSDLKPLRKLQLPKPEVIRVIADHVDSSPSKIQNILEGYIAQAQAEKDAN